MTCTVFETSAYGVDTVLPQLYASAAAVTEAVDYHVWMHFGVDGRATAFDLERRAVNDATFRSELLLSQLR